MPCRSVGHQKKLSVAGLILSSVLVLFFQLPILASQSVTLAWNPSADANVAGYRIYYGLASGDYSSVVTVANTDSVSIADLEVGTTYYFAAAAFDAAGNEGDLSDETSFTAPVAVAPRMSALTASLPAVATLSAPVRAAGQFTFTVTGPAGQSCVVQASANLLNWISLQTNTVPFTFVDTNAANCPQRFYRTYNFSP